MTIWWTALKVIPWGDVLEKAPAVVAGAKRVFASARKTPSRDVAPAAAPDALQQQLAALQAEQESMAQLIETLAEQNARLVGAVEILRMRTRLLAAATVGLLALVVWLAIRGNS